MTLFLVILALEFPAIMALIDCYHRRPVEFAGGEPDRRSWIRWLWVAIGTCWLLVGNAIILGYYWAVVKRQTPLGRA
ncbi:MAG TPA: hypothetical protein VI916_02850 [Acidimicrobiia bacterium]|nr:hypothetical protein [Acidimicrobiia bacterium]